MECGDLFRNQKDLNLRCNKNKECKRRKRENKGN